MRFFLWVAGGLLAMMAGAASAAGGVEALRAFYEEVDTLSATFEQVQRDGSGNVIQEAGGVFLLARPDRFRWAYETPYEQIIVSNGDAFRFYDVDLAQVTIRSASASLRATPAQLLAGGASLEDAFEVRDGGDEDGLAWVTMIPRSDDSDFKAIRFGLDGRLPAVMELDDQLGDTTRIRFNEVEVNPDLAAERFELEIPEDATVVDGRESRR